MPWPMATGRKVSERTARLGTHTHTHGPCHTGVRECRLLVLMLTPVLASCWQSQVPEVGGTFVISSLATIVH